MAFEKTKTFIKENKKPLIIGGCVVAAGTVGYVLYRRHTAEAPAIIGMDYQVIGAAELAQDTPASSVF